MEIFKLAAIILTAVIVVGALPTFSKEISLIITLSCCTVILLYILKMIVPVVEYVRELTRNIYFDRFDVVLKAVGVGLITQFVSDTAIDCGNRSLANQMIFAGRICVLMLAIPVFVQVLGIIERLTNL
ncbi:MAG: hypothetical protein IKU47_07890 [Oscillospiraceae bacterium]|nr:hypothetical protein [Oscillospiraceae bacterium]